MLHLQLLPLLLRPRERSVCIKFAFISAEAGFGTEMTRDEVEMTRDEVEMSRDEPLLNRDVRKSAFPKFWKLKNPAKAASVKVRNYQC